MTTTDNGYVTYHSENSIGTIEFFHPKGNSLPGTILKELRTILHEASNDPSTQVLVLRSGGTGAFCAGASFDELCSISNADEGKEFFMGFANVINAMRTCPKMILCRVHGKAVGGGIGIVAASDFSVAIKGASIRLSELSLGIGPFVVGPAVGRKLGTSAFATLAIDSNTWYGSDWAVANGLYNKLTDSIEELDEEIESLAKRLSKSNPNALHNLKEIMWQSTGHWSATLEQRAEISGELVLSDYTRNFIDDFQKNHK